MGSGWFNEDLNRNRFIHKPVPASIRGQKKGIIMDGTLIHSLETFQLLFDNRCFNRRVNYYYLFNTSNLKGIFLYQARARFRIN